MVFNDLVWTTRVQPLPQLTEYCSTGGIATICGIVGGGKGKEICGVINHFGGGDSIIVQHMEILCAVEDCCDVAIIEFDGDGEL